MCKRKTDENSKETLRIYSKMIQAVSKEHTSFPGKMNMYGTIGIILVVFLQVVGSHLEQLIALFANIFRGYRADINNNDITIQVLIIAVVFIICLGFMIFVIKEENKVKYINDHHNTDDK